MKSETAISKKVLKKEARQKVYDKLVVALAEFKAGAKNKKFEKKLRRASKLFAADIINSNYRAKLAAGKVVKKKAAEQAEESAQKTA